MARNVSVQLSPELQERARTRAELEARTVASLVRRALAYYLDTTEAAPKMVAGFTTGEEEAGF